MDHSYHLSRAYWVPVPGNVTHVTSFDARGRSWDYFSPTVSVGGAEAHRS